MWANFWGRRGRKARGKQYWREVGNIEILKY
jgi:hypothetical protein